MRDTAWEVTAGGPGRALHECLVAAAAAPSIHNSQPWLFRLGRDVIDVLVDRRRQLAWLDPEGREMAVSVGAALLNLRVAVRARGRAARVRLTPDQAEPALAARVFLGAPTQPNPEVLALAAAIPHRHTNRRPFADLPVPAGVMDELARATAAEGGSMLAADPALRDAVLSLTRTAENRMRTDPHYVAELAAWTTPGGVGRRDGVPRQAFGPRDRHAALPLRDFALANGAPTATVTFEPEPTLILLFTVGDSEVDWLRAGAALQRMLLAGTVRGLAATPLSQLVEIPKLRHLLTETAGGRVVQSVLRIGYPITPAQPTPRRPVIEIIQATPGGRPA
jgi:nitroreductase